MARRKRWFDRRRDVIRVRLIPVEAALLRSMLGDLRLLADEPGLAGDAVAQRLEPVAYEHDPVAEEDYRSMTSLFAATERKEAIDRMEAVLDAGAKADGAVDGAMQFDDAELWLQAINQLRLITGTTLGIEQDDDLTDRLESSEAATVVQYAWLTDLQYALIDELE